MRALLQDLRYGARMLAKNPRVSVIAVLSLAIGIGANTAMFGVVNAVLLQPLPFSEPDRLVWVWGNIRGGANRASVAPLDYLDYRTQNSSFEQFAAMFTVPNFINLTGNGEPERLQGRVVSGNFFQALGVHAAIGRTFLPDNERPGNDQVVVLSHGFWQRRFAGDRSLIGKTLTLDGRQFEVLGVMPRGFQFPRDTEFWAPMNFDIAPDMKQRKAHFLRPIGRLKAGMPLRQAQADLDAVARHIEEQYPDSNAGCSVRLVPLRDQLVGNVRPVLQMLFGAVGFVLLIACANVANLLLVHTASRRREVAVRMAIGAGRFAIVRQMLAESVLLALAGGALGVFVASWAIDLIVALSGNNIPPTAQIGIDHTVLAFTLGLSLLTGVLFGLAPAWQATRLRLSGALNEGSAGSGHGAERQRIKSVLVIFETAVAVVLLIGAGLLTRSLAHLQQVNPGFDATNVLTARLDLPFGKYAPPEQAASFWSQLQERLASLPGVEAVGMVTELPLSGQPNDVPFTVEGRPPVQANEAFGADFRGINHDYLRAMAIPLLRGRAFTAQEARQSAPVVLISEGLARTVFTTEEPLGKRLRVGNRTFEIVGIAGDIHHRALDATPYATMYVPTLRSGRTNLAIRVAGNPLNLTAAVRREVQAVDREQPISAVRTMEQVLSESVAGPRYRMWVLGGFALMALLLAAIGIFGVVSYMVAQRTREIGIRMALGALPRHVRRLVVVQAVRIVAIGVLAGLVGGAVLTRVVRNAIAGLLFQVEPTDPLTLASVGVILMLVALMACYLPARRASKIDPMLALRHE